MILTLAKQSALRALRVFRKTGKPLPQERVDLPAPDPAPRRRWSRDSIPLERLALADPPSAERPIDVLVPRAGQRLRSSFLRCSMRSSSIPPRSFVCLGGGLHVPCPELLFASLADEMTPEAHELLAFELCGTYSRDAQNPRLGEVTYGIEPVTSVEKIGRFVDKLGRRRSALPVRHHLSYAADNAWSPMEAIVALMARLPVHELGYVLGGITLNVRHGSTPEMIALGCRESRVPDIEVLGTHVGFNYDSQSHLDLESIAAAASEGSAEAAIRRVRQKYRDDLKRNRELAALGRIILVVTSDDLFVPGGLDAVMLEAAMVIDELDGGGALSNVRVALSSGPDRKRRQDLLWSLLPWEQGIQYAHMVEEWVAWRV